jgi:hypothetical protein
MSPHGAHEDHDHPRGGTEGETGADRAGEGLDHLQAAALEMIAAARAFLDVAEDLVVDRAKVAGVVDAVASVADGFTRTRGDATDPPAEEPPSGPVEHIKVS